MSLRNLSDPSWELIDPTPDLHTMFMNFNNQFFDGVLAACEVKWSPRMTSCAGICYYQPKAGYCSVRLSEPLLKLRSRKDFLETLLHEMIHAYLFITARNQDRDGHGPEFQSHMHRINRITGLNITIYHSFHDEVANYKTHWWRCNGSCRDRPPYYGWVKRASNRAPSKNDFWWAEHQTNCGGVFEKVKEPERKKKMENQENKDGKKRKAIENNDRTQKKIDSYFSPKKASSNELDIELIDIYFDDKMPSASTASSKNQWIPKMLMDVPIVSSEVVREKRNRFLASIETSTQSKKKPSNAQILIIEDDESPGTSSAKTKNEIDCPACSRRIPLAEINQHLDECAI